VLGSIARAVQAKGRDMMVDRFVELLGVTAVAGDAGEAADDEAAAD
jgi:hypothetical protein